MQAPFIAEVAEMSSMLAEAPETESLAVYKLSIHEAASRQLLVVLKANVLRARESSANVDSTGTLESCKANWEPVSPPRERGLTRQ